MNRKYGILILAIIFIASVSMIYVVQAKNQPQSSNEVHTEYLSLGPETGGSSMVSSIYEPPSPKVVSVWILVDDQLEGFDDFQMHSVSYDEKSVTVGDPFPFIDLTINGKEKAFPVLLRVAIANPIEIRLYRSQDGGGDTDTLEVQWIIED